MKNLIYPETLPANKKIKVSEFNGSDFKTTSPYMLPQMKISFTGQVLSASRSAKKLLLQLKTENPLSFSRFLSAQHPEILQRGCCTDFEIRTENFLYRFSAVAFDEADYIGLYCYRIIRTRSRTEPQIIH